MSYKELTTETVSDAIYKTSDIRLWLKNEFINYFTSDELRYVLDTTYESANNEYVIEHLTDKFYILSMSEYGLIADCAMIYEGISFGQKARLNADITTHGAFAVRVDADGAAAVFIQCKAESAFTFRLSQNCIKGGRQHQGNYNAGRKHPGKGMFESATL